MATQQRSAKQPRRRLPFPEYRAASVFNERFTALVGELLRQMVAAQIPPENTHTFYHGRQWTHRRSDGADVTGGVKANSAELELRFDAVVEGSLSTIAAQARAVVEQMQSNFMRMLYETVNDAVEQVGNVVDAAGKPTPEAILEALRKIEFGVNRKGEVTRPSIHVHWDKFPAIMKALHDAGPDFESEVKRVTADKEAEALIREAARKSRFRQLPEPQ